MLFRIPELRGRVAYDVRFELYDGEFFDRLQDYNFEDGADWKSFADGYRIVDRRRTAPVAHRPTSSPSRAPRRSTATTNSR